MSDTYLELFLHMCAPHKNLTFPEEMEGDPIQAYGAYAFEEGFKLALLLVAPLLTLDDHNPFQ